MIKLKEIYNEIAQKDSDLIHKYGGEIIEKENLGEYELALVSFGGIKNVISLTRNNQTYFEPGSQNKKIPEQPSILPIKKIIEIIHSWLDKYGNPLFIGSSNPDRTKYYYKWLSEEFNCSNISNYGMNPFTQSYEYGFSISSKLNEIKIIGSNKLIAKRKFNPGGFDGIEYYVDVYNINNFPGFYLEKNAGQDYCTTYSFDIRNKNFLEVKKYLINLKVPFTEISIGKSHRHYLKIPLKYVEFING